MLGTNLLLVRIARSTLIAILGMGTTIGEGSVFYPGVKLLARCQIGKQVILNAGVVVGSEGYGFDQGDGSHQKIPHLGKSSSKIM